VPRKSSASGDAINDIARETGVSIATVSRVLNGRPDVASATRSKVLAYIRQRDYVSNRIARASAQDRTGLVGVMAPKITGGYFSEILAGVAEALDERELRPIICATRHEREREDTLIGRFAGGAADALILIRPAAPPAKLAALYHQRYPFVVVDPTHSVEDPIPVVASANRAGALRATEHLLGLGHRRIGVITGRPGEVATRDRLEGYTYALTKRGIPSDPGLVRVDDFEFAGGYRAAIDLLALPDRPTAIFAFNDAMAAGVIRAAREKGLTLPEDLSIVGFDDAETAAYATPALTSVRQPLQDMGRVAVEMLDRLIAQRQLDATRIELSTRLIERSSTVRVDCGT